MLLRWKVKGAEQRRRLEHGMRAGFQAALPLRSLHAFALFFVVVIFKQKCNAVCRIQSWKSFAILSGH